MRDLVRRRVQVPVTACVVALLVALALGCWVGTASPLGTKHMHVLTGHARLMNHDGLVAFETGDPDEQKSFYAPGTWFEETALAERSPYSCLRYQRDVPVRIGWTTVKRPDGGSFDTVTWVDCLGS